MKLLITTQAVDLDDPVLGFFHRWIEVLAGKVDSIEVICLKEGRHSLPKNVVVHSLGKEGGHSRIKYLTRFYRYIWGLRDEYDAVFVHMNQEYVLLGGLLWRVLGKRVVLWRNHKRESFFTNIAGWLAHTVCFTSPSAYVATFKNGVQMPIGIDTELFKPSGTPDPHSILFLGRLDEVKRPDIFLEAMRILEKEFPAARADVVGDPTSGGEAYADALKKRFADVKNVSFYAGVPNTATPSLYASHDVYVNLTPSGSFDKTIGEAMACGAIAVVNNDAVQGVLPRQLTAGDTAKSAASAIKAALTVSTSERTSLAQKERVYVVENHSLSLLVYRLVPLFISH